MIEVDSIDVPGIWPEAGLVPALVAIDTETGGFDAGEVALLQVGLAWRDPQGEIATRAFDVIPEPGLRVDLQALEVNGWRGVPAGAVPEARVLEHLAGPLSLVSMLEGRVVAHYAAFDREHLRAAYTRHGHDGLPRWNWACTWESQKRVHGGRHGGSLDMVCERYGIERQTKDGAHDAALDAVAALQVAEVTWPGLKGVWR